MIHEEADTLATSLYDNYLLATFAPSDIEREVDEDIVRDTVCLGEFSMDRAVSVYAYEIWRIGIEKELKSILIERCEKAGLISKVKSILRRW